MLKSHNPGTGKRGNFALVVAHFDIGLPEYVFMDAVESICDMPDVNIYNWRHGKFAQ